MSTYQIYNSTPKIWKIQELSSVINILNKEENYQFHGTPLIFHSEFKDSFKEIIYYIEDENCYKRYECEIFHRIKLEDYWISPNKAWKNFEQETIEKPYAYGILINPYYTKLIALDFDGVDDIYMEQIVQIFLANNIYGIDLVKTQNSIMGNHYHLYLGLNDYYNVTQFYTEAFPKSCKGFNKYVNNKHYIVIRVSDKKNIRQVGVAPTLQLCLRQINKEWFNFYKKEIVYPYKQEKPEVNKLPEIKNKINLRKKNGENNTEQKVQRKKITTINSIKDFANMARVNI